MWPREHGDLMGTWPNGHVALGARGSSGRGTWPEQIADLSICWSEHDMSRCFRENGGTLLMSWRSWPEPGFVDYKPVDEDGLLGAKPCLGGCRIGELWLWTSLTPLFRINHSAWKPEARGRDPDPGKGIQTRGKGPRPGDRNPEPEGRNLEAGTWSILFMEYFFPNNPSTLEERHEAKELPSYDYVCAQLQKELGSDGLFCGKGELSMVNKAEKMESASVNKAHFKIRRGGDKSVTCEHCKDLGHSKTNCWILRPHLRPASTNR
ncbi:hypothetical protein F2Q69_00047821 [Brassica cretica]|uniref:Uncharacterized protein n=1 Tax=Brassica cretica TaxID=69181 RepID=A0A8S9PZW9_BRACR|nr:hypothetical protein F2Q69_00047821 [Brassica cretica]